MEAGGPVVYLEDSRVHREAGAAALRPDGRLQLRKGVRPTRFRRQVQLDLDRLRIDPHYPEGGAGAFHLLGAETLPRCGEGCEKRAREERPPS